MIVLTLEDIIAIVILSIVGIALLAKFIQEVVGGLLNRIKSSFHKRESGVE